MDKLISEEENSNSTLSDTFVPLSLGGKYALSLTTPYIANKKPLLKCKLT
jgi:hypothetical protein